MSKILKLFDINAYAGKPAQSLSGEWYDTADALLKDMEYYRIEKAIVTHFTAKEAHPDTGNDEVMKFISGKKKLMPAWTFVPSTGKKSDAPRVIKSAFKAGAGLLRYYPNEYFCSLSENAIGDFLEIAEEKYLPLFVDFSKQQQTGFQTDWESIISVCKKYKKLPVITTEFRIRSNRMFFRALALCENLKVCTSSIWLYKNIEFIIREFGAHRLIFGTNMPEFDPSIPVSMLKFAEISDKDKMAIGSGNIEKLLVETKL